MAKKSIPTHVLILEAAAGAQVATFELLRGSEKVTVAAHAKWREIIANEDLINIPGDLPVTIGRQTVVCLRVASIPPAVLKAEELEKKWEGDPRRAAYMNKFVNNARDLGKDVEEKGVDILDQGYK